MRIVKTLKNALTLYSLVAATLPLALFAIVVLYYANDYLTHDILKNNAEIAYKLREETQSFLLQRRLLLEHIGDNLFIDHLVDKDDIDRYMHGELAKSIFFDIIVVVNRSGRVQYFASRKTAPSLYEDMRNVDFSGHELYQRYIRQESPDWSGAHASLTSGGPAISFGTVAGDFLLIGTIGLDQIPALLGHFGAAPDSLTLPSSEAEVVFALADQDGVVIAHTNPDHAQRRESLRFHRGVVAALAGDDNTIIESHADHKLVETAALVPETGWVVWVARDYETAMSPLIKVRNLFFTVFFAAVLMVLLAVVITGRNLMLPLRQLLNDVRLLGLGCHPMLPPRQSYHEIDELSVSFQNMAMAVQEREASLKAEERRFRSLVNSVEGIVFEVTLPDMQMTFVSEHAEVLTGFSQECWLADSEFWQKRVHPEDRQWAVDYRTQQSLLGHPFQYEYRLQHKDGRTLWLREMASVVTEVEGPARLLGVAIDITASKEAELSLQESEQRFRSLVEQAADAIFIHDLRGQLLDVNEQACRSLGYHRDELQALHIKDVELIQHPLQFSSLWNSVQRGGSLTFEAEHRRKDGSLFPVEVRLGAFQYRDQPMLLALARDITDRKRSFLALRESEERYRSVVSAMTEGVLLTDNNGIIVASNPASERIFGQSHAQMQSRLISEVLPQFADETGPVLSQDQLPEARTRKTGKPVRQAVLARLSAGKAQSWFEINTQPVFHFGETGVAGVVTTFSDVTERKMAIAALQRSEEQVRLLLNSTAEGIYGLDLQGRVTFCNPAALRLFGYDKERDLLDQDMHTLVHAHHADGSIYPVDDCPMRAVRLTNEVVHRDSEVFWRADGSSFDVEYWAHPIRKGGALLGVVVTFHDITERKRMQQQTIRNAQLASLGELAAGVAHEINNPVSGVINYAQILLNQAKKQGAETDLVERILHEGERIATIVRDMLFFAREGGGEMRLSRLVDLLQDAISLSAAQLRKEGIALQLNIPEDLPPIRARAQQIQQLFLNLLSNARHALKEKYPQSDPDKVIIISAQVIQAKEGPLVGFVVEDHGIGIPEKMLPRIMNPFVTTKPAGVGTGLGLSIGYEIIKQHGGDIRIESLEGEMTRVFVELPSAKGELV